MKPKKKSFEAWFDGTLASERHLREQVDAAVAEMALDQELARLRERAGVSQRELARRLGVSQPVVARLESGRAADAKIKTLARTVVALGGRLRIAIEPARSHAGAARRRG